MTTDRLGVEYKVEYKADKKTPVGHTSLQVQEEIVLNANEVRNYTAKATQDHLLVLISSSSKAKKHQGKALTRLQAAEHHIM